MQKNDSILECIFRENLDLICGLNNLEFLNRRFVGYVNKNWFGTSPKTTVSFSYKIFDPNKNDRAKYNEVIFFEKREKSFKKNYSYPPIFSNFF